MAAYLPYGKRIKPSPEKIKFQQDKFKKYDYYGIPYGGFDASDEGSTSQMQQDQEEARLLILQGKEIPEDLTKRLLQYKDSKGDVVTA